MTKWWQKRTTAAARRGSARLDAAAKLAVLHRYWRRHSLRAGRYATNPRDHPGTSTGTIWPVAGVVTSLFGDRPDPVKGNRQFHTGIDIYTPSGTPVRAVLPGWVKVARYLGRLGRTVVISHRKGVETLYAHNSVLSVRRGQRVRTGQVIGFSGDSGRVTGPHVHYEVWVRGRRVDPLKHLRKNSRVILAEVIDRL